MPRSSWLRSKAFPLRRRLASPAKPQSPEGLLKMSDLDPDFDKKPSRWLWGMAAMGALALHLGGVALAIAHLQTGDFDDGLGASGVEIAFEMASPKVTDENLPPGPETDASLASPQLAEQKAEVKETDLPKDTPTESEDPDRSEEHTSELQSQSNLVCRLLLEKKKQYRVTFAQARITLLYILSERLIPSLSLPWRPNDAPIVLIAMMIPRLITHFITSAGIIPT